MGRVSQNRHGERDEYADGVEGEREVEGADLDTKYESGGGPARREYLSGQSGGDYRPGLRGEGERVELEDLRDCEGVCRAEGNHNCGYKV